MCSAAHAWVGLGRIVYLYSGTQYRALLQVSTSGGSTIAFAAADLLRLDQKSDDGDTATLRPSPDAPIAGFEQGVKILPGHRLRRTVRRARPGGHFEAVRDGRVLVPVERRLAVDNERAVLREGRPRRGDATRSSWTCGSGAPLRLTG